MDIVIQSSFLYSIIKNHFIMVSVGSNFILFDSMNSIERV
jgi:hypothetical protein